MQGLSVLKKEHDRRDRYTGTVIGGRWLVQQRLGGGGEGAVYRAVTVDGSAVDVAIKIRFGPGEEPTHPALIGGLPSDPILREHAVLARLGDPHFPRAVATGVTESGHTYLVRDYVGGPSLEAVSRRSRRMPVARAVALVARLCDAGHALHRGGFWHRDIKPANIIISGRLCDEGAVTLLDYGAAWAIDAGADGTRPPSGTPAYMAPEQAEGRVGSGAAADIYSVAAVAFELLTGVHVLGRAIESSDSALQWLGSGRPIPFAPLGPLRPDAPSELSFVVSRALSRNPIDRGDSLAALRDALLEAAPEAAGVRWAPSDDDAERATWTRRMGEALSRFFRG